MKRRMLTLAGILAISVCAVAAACPMCKDSIPNGESASHQAGSLPSGFNYSVYYMLGGLFLTLGMVGTAVYKGLRSTNVHVDPRLRGFEVKPKDPIQRD